MKLSDLEKGDKALIVSIGTDESLKGRLFSFGIARGTEISIEACSLGKQTVEIMAEETLVGLRMSEAQKIEVRQLNKAKEEKK
ncbi:MAG: Ferrous iron transport protein A, putative [uncultured Sulfurovum sp.]|uniref:Ferrous iron transport protein A, putative n=1 Tax=uncultured Sulfurovum sp. TaxID=269237 RepID=A0A6S6RTA6_9BACT|nr:MAG: Ferrous iron transport protein A, putative [uncultured Sulfurovum sp.]